MTAPERWEHARALEVTREILKTLRNKHLDLIWRGEMLCCKSVETKTLPKMLVQEVLENMRIMDSTVEELGLSLYFPGGDFEFRKHQGCLPSLVLGGSKSRSGADPSSLY